MSVLTVYSKPDCHLCAEAMSVLRRLQGELGFVLQELKQPLTFTHCGTCSRRCSRPSI